jgi:hypothetical protein
MIKSPVFGFIIAAIGCLRTCRCGSAEGVGRLTTRSSSIDLLRDRAWRGLLDHFPGQRMTAETKAKGAGSSIIATDGRSC